MHVLLSTLESSLDRTQYSLIGDPNQPIQAVRLYDPQTEFSEHCLYLCDGREGPVPEAPFGCVMCYHGTAPAGSCFEDFVNRVFDAFLRLASSPDRITERISVLARCRSIQQLLDAGSELLGRGLLLTDMNYQLVAASALTPPEHMLWRRILALKEIPMNLATSVSWMDAWQTALGTHLPCLTADPEPTGRVLLYAIDDMDCQNGILLTDGTKGALSVFEQEVIVVLGRFLSADMQKRVEYRMAARSALDHFFCFLLQGNTYPDATLAQRAAALSWQPGRYMRILAFHSDSYEDPGSFTTYSDVIRDLPKSGSDRVVFFEGDVVLLLCGNQPITAKSPAIQQILQFAEAKHLLMGISREFESLRFVHQSYLQARDALDMGAVLDAGGHVYWYEEYADYRLLQMCARTIDLREFCHPGLLRLYESDQASGSCYIETLKTYLENQRSISRTAQLLHIHRNTVTYRVEHCLSVCGTNLEKRQNLLHILLSLHILDLLAMNPENIFRMEAPASKKDDLHAESGKL